MDDVEGMIVIDNGSGSIKAGWSGEDAPMYVFPTTIGRPRDSDSTLSDFYVGDSAQAKREILNMRYPIERGIITDWDDMEKIWSYTFDNEMRVDPKEHSLVHSEAPLTQKANRERMTQIMFETFECRAMYVAIQAVLALYSSGRTTGVVVDSGFGVTHTVPIYEGYSMPHSIKKSNFGGEDVTRYQEELLKERSYLFNTHQEKEIPRNIKENFTYVALDFDQEIEKAKNLTESTLLRKSYELPDGNHISIVTEKFTAPEALFNPALAGIDDVGIHKNVYKSIMDIDICCRKDLYANIVLTGGNTMFDGLDSRLQKEVAALAPQTIKVKVAAADSGKYDCWLGGAMMANLNSFRDTMITKCEYEETGPTIVHERCI